MIQTRGSHTRLAVRIVVVGVVGWLLLAPLAARLLVVQSSPGQADVIVVLSGSTAFEDRRGHAVELFKRGVAPRIVLTNDNIRGGWDFKAERNPLFVERAVVELREAGVPADRIVALPEVVSSTYDEAVLLRDYMLRNRLGSLLVVTSPYHSRRSFWTFRRVLDGSGITVGIDTNGTNGSSPSMLTWWLSGQGWRSVGMEYPKMVYYWFKY